MSATAAASRAGVQMLLGVLLLGLLAGFIAQAFHWRDQSRSRATTIHAQASTAAAATGIAGDLDTTLGTRADVEHGIDAARARTTRDLEDLSHASPPVRDFRALPVPGQLRDLARARRLARDRLDAAAAGRGATDPPAPGSALR